jgi:hypothetical protein
VREGHDLNFITDDGVDDAKGIALNELATVALPDFFPKLGEGSDFLAGFFVRKSSGNLKCSENDLTGGKLAILQNALKHHTTHKHPKSAPN